MGRGTAGGYVNMATKTPHLGAGYLMQYGYGTPDQNRLVFDVNQPLGAPAGQSRAYSAVSAYSIDSPSGTAEEVRRFDYNQSIDSPVCSGAYEVPGGSVLVNYAVAANYTEARLVGLDAAHNVVFDFRYPTQNCSTSWNAIPIALEDLAIN